MVATDVASRGIGMNTNPPPRLIAKLPASIVMRDLLDALLRSSRALATLAPMTWSRSLCFLKLNIRFPWMICR